MTLPMVMSPEVVIEIIVTLREHGDAALNFIGRLGFYRVQPCAVYRHDNIIKG